VSGGNNYLILPKPARDGPVRAPQQLRRLPFDIAPCWDGRRKSGCPVTASSLAGRASAANFASTPRLWRGSGFLQAARRQAPLAGDRPQAYLDR